jgi:hypothetical protein
MRSLFVRAVLAYVAAIGAIGIAAGADSDPVIGTWQLNVAKSTFSAGPATASQTRTYSQSGASITLVMKSTGADGTTSTTQTTYQLDGKDYPVMGTPDYDTVSAKRVNSHTATFALKRAGKTVGTTTRTVSKDGKVLTTKSKMTTASGAKSENVLVFDKQ